MATKRWYSFSFEAFGDIDELMANLPDFAATPPRLSDVGATPSHLSTTFGTAPPRPSVFAMTDGDELQRLHDKNKNKNTKIHKHMGESSPEMAGTLLDSNEQQLDKTILRGGSKRG